MIPTIGQVIPVPPHHPGPPPQWVYPANRWVGPALPQGVQVSAVSAEIGINDQAASTALEITLTNPVPRPQEAVLLMPCPSDAVLKSFSYDGMPAHAEGQAKILPRDEARRIYDQIVAQTRDPALLEFADAGCVRSSVFPVPANGQQKVRLIYEQLLPVEGSRVDYLLPRSEALDFEVPWQITVKVKSPTNISAVYSPSHDITTIRDGAQAITAKTTDRRATGPFRLSVLREKPGELTASMLAYPDPKVGGGYFLLLVAPPAPNPDAVAKIKREVCIVLDRSGSMAGQKLDQAKAAALQVLEGLSDGEGFNLVVYHESVETFSPQPVILTPEVRKQARDYISALRVSGGTNIHDALVEALRQKPLEGMLPLVLFLTDGLPTIGQTSEKAIREAAAAGNPHQRRIFSFGVGLDVNTALLSRLAREARGTASYVLPTEDVELKVGAVYKRLRGPVLAAPSLKVIDTAGQPAPGRVMDLLPSLLPDIFDSDQLVLLGRYQNDQPLKFELNGGSTVGPRTFHFEFQMDKATTANSFVPRLWASNKIAVLSEAIRDLGADLPLAAGRNQPLPDSRMKELIDEIVRLSTQFGILTEYTAFLATDSAPLAQAPQLRRQAEENYQLRALPERAGAAGVNQELNIAKAKEAKFQSNRDNYYYDAELKKVEITKVQQLNNSAYFQRGSRWVEGSAAATDKAADQTVEIGSADFNQLVNELAADHRQSVLALRGEILIEHRGKRVLVK